LAITGAGRVDLASANDFVGGVTIMSGTLDLAARQAAGSGPIRFATGQDATLQFTANDAPTNKIMNFVRGDTIRIDDYDAAGHVVAGGTLLLSGSPGDVALALPGLTASGYQVSGSGTATVISAEMVPCFRSGTLLLSETGMVAVEHLKPGDRLLTPGGAAREVVWIGHRFIDCRRHPRPHEVWPVRVAPDAFAPGAPLRPLFLSPDHAVSIEDVLIPIRHLINQATIRPVPVDTVTYWHVELARHDIVVAEGLGCESFLDTGNRAMFDNHRVTDLHASMGAHAAAAGAAWPVVEDGEVVARARRALHDRAASMGHTQDRLAEIPLNAIGPVTAMVAGAAEAVRLVSASAFVPGDRRRLGALVTALLIDGRQLDLADPRLGLGFHPLEWHGPNAVRWTDGGALLCLGTAQAAREVAVHVAAQAATAGRQVA
jgi:autotransporter-associated beta strand protein